MNLPLTKPSAIDISIQDPEWELIKDIHQIIETTAVTALNSALLPKAAQDRELEISIVLANDDLVQVLNREYREKDKPTNVLTFASLDDPEGIPEEGALNLGDIILSFQTLEREAQEQGKYPLDHIRHLTVHGILHLLGYDHQTDEEANDMETLEITILQKLGVQNPYTEMNL